MRNILTVFAGVKHYEWRLTNQITRPTAYRIKLRQMELAQYLKFI